LAKSDKKNKNSDEPASNQEATGEVAETAAATDAEMVEADAKPAEDAPSEKPTDEDTMADAVSKPDDAEPAFGTDAPNEVTEASSDKPAEDGEPGVDTAQAADRNEAATEAEGERAEALEGDAQDARAGEPEEVPDSEDQKADAQHAVSADAEADQKSEPEKPEGVVPPVAPGRPEPKPEPQVVRGSMWPAFFGGVIAALVGFIAGRGDMLDQYLPASMQRASVDLAEIEATIEQETAALAAQSEAQIARIDALEAIDTVSVLATVSALESDLAVLTDRLAAIENQPAVSVDDSAASEAVAAMQTALADLQSKIDTLEQSAEPAGAVSSIEDALAAQQAKIAEQDAKIADLVARAEEAESNAAGEAQRILARAALARVETAVDSGEGFATSLSDLEEVAPVEVPPALRDAAEAGVPTLASLQGSFPDAARAGLAAARAEVPESEVSGITGFLKRQLNVRSLTPREGSDPDAVLSRAQAAVNAGDLATALTEMEALPEAARTAMSDWLEAATARKAAQDAARELADSLNSN
jgi:hypothetical protein